MSDDKPLTHAELQKLDDGIYISEVRKNQAGAVVRTRETADKSWKIAAAVAAIVLAAGFSDRLRESATWIQLLGAIAILLWLLVAGLFLWVNHNPAHDDPVWIGARQSVQDSMAAEISEAEGDRVRVRETYAKLQNRTALKFISHRFKIATTWAMVALATTGIAMVATVLADDEQSSEGKLLLTSDGTAAVLKSCPLLDGDSINNADAKLDVSKIGIDEPLRVTFDAGVCDQAKIHLFLDGELVEGLVDP